MAIPSGPPAICLTRASTCGGKRCGSTRERPSASSSKRVSIRSDSWGRPAPARPATPGYRSDPAVAAWGSASQPPGCTIGAGYLLPYKPPFPISRINAAAGSAPVRVAPETLERADRVPAPPGDAYRSRRHRQGVCPGQSNPVAGRYPSSRRRNGSRGFPQPSRFLLQDQPRGRDPGMKSYGLAATRDPGPGQEKVAERRHLLRGG